MRKILFLSINTYFLFKKCLPSAISSLGRNNYQHKTDVKTRFGLAWAAAQARTKMVGALSRLENHGLLSNLAG